MQLKSVEIKNLFGFRNHHIDFPTSENNDKAPSVVMLHGPNGIGKTRILKMLAGIMKLDFDPFREVPFSEFRLTFNNDISIHVSKDPTIGTLVVTFDNKSATLHPSHSGPYFNEDYGQIANVVAFREHFFASTESINLELIDSIRAPPPPPPAYGRNQGAPEFANSNYRWRPKHEDDQQPSAPLADKVRNFLLTAQVHTDAFFSASEPDTFTKILDNLSQEKLAIHSPDQLRNRLELLHTKNKEYTRLGLEPDKWDHEKLITFLAKPFQKHAPNALTALATYIDILETRAAQRSSLAKRLNAFETYLGQFLRDKRVSISRKHGLFIATRNDQQLNESQLSSGEYNLLYLLVAALVTRRRGTVIAIDEPELSMHIEWQRKLLAALIACSVGAELQFLFATHSPDIAATCPEALVCLGDDND